MEAHEIDMRLQRYTAAEHRIGSNLQELEQHAVYQLLMTDVLAGATAKALKSLTTANPTLWQLFTLLGSKLEEARRLRGDGSRMRAEIRLELGELLTQRSILLNIAEVPLAERGLTGASTNETRVTIEDLIETMSTLYEPVRDVVTHAEEVLRQLLPRLNSAETTVNRLRGEANGLSLDTIDLDRIQETIDRIRDLSLTDPLSIPADARNSFDEALANASRRIAKARSSHDELAADIAAADHLLDECRELIERADHHRAEAVAKIVAPIGLRQPPGIAAIDGPKGLASRLEPIVTSTKPWQTVRRNLDGWAHGAVRLRDQLKRVADANAQPLLRRDELRGRLTAFRAKMAGTGQSEDLVLRDLSAEAHNELFTAPTDLARADRLVTEFGNRLATP